MKRIVFLTVCVIYSLSSFAQKTIAVNDVLNLELPRVSQKITKEQAIDHAGRKFNNNKTVLNSVNNRISEHIYKVDDILISIHAQNNRVKADHLLRMKRGLDEMYIGNKTYTSTLKKVNNNSMLIENFTDGNIENYTLFCFNAANSRSVSIVLEFNKTDADEATNILNRIVDSIKFKD